MRSLFRLGVALFWALILAPPAFCQEQTSLTIAVYGDSLGDGAWSGLYLLLHNDTAVHVLRHSKVGAGLTRGDYDGWFADMKADLDKSKPDVAVILFGGNDQQSLRDERHKGYLFPSDGWKAVYAGRVEAVMAELEKREILTIWLGLPIMRKDELNKGARILDTIFAAEAARYHVRFVPLVSDFTNDAGDFVTHLPDAHNRSRQIRADDGVHFTGYGYELLAQKIWAEIQRDRGAAPAGATDH